MSKNNFKGLTAYQVYPIGYIHRDGDNMYLEILEPFRPALKQLENFSHVTVLFWADQHDSLDERGSYLQTEPPYAPGVTTGIFATRSEVRPNPILSTPCKIEDLDQENGILRVNKIDGFDGTPILDLKGYFPIMDRVRDATIPEWLDWGLEWVPDEGLGLYEEMEEE